MPQTIHRIVCLWHSPRQAHNLKVISSNLGPSLTLRAFVIQNSPPDCFVALRATIPHPTQPSFKTSCLRWCGVFGFGAGCSFVCDKNRSSPNATNLSQRYVCPPKVALQLVMRVGDSSRSRPQPPVQSVPMLTKKFNKIPLFGHLFHETQKF